jgi:hypothetical protein
MKSPIVLLSLIFATTLAILGALLAMWPNAVVASAVFSIVFVVVAGSVVAAILCIGGAAAVWRGFAIFAVAYFTLAVLAGDLWSAANDQLGVAAQPPRPAFVTSYVLAWAYDAIGKPQMWTSGGTRIPAIHLLRVPRQQLPTNIDFSEFDAFMTTGHCGFTLAFGLLGGVAGLWFYRAREPEAGEHVEPYGVVSGPN